VPPADLTISPHLFSRLSRRLRRSEVQRDERRILAVQLAKEAVVDRTIAQQCCRDSITASREARVTDPTVGGRIMILFVVGCFVYEDASSCLEKACAD